jgi:pyruvyltransferase
MNLIIKSVKILVRHWPVREFNKEHAGSKKIHLEWWSETKNVGDMLSVVIYDWMLASKNLRPKSADQQHRRLLGLGSIIGQREYDAIIWGSGLHRQSTIAHVEDFKKIIRYDIRAVRGPKTREVLLNSGYDCPEVYGDPAILLPWIICSDFEKKWEVSYIAHYLQKGKESVPEGVHVIDVQNTSPQDFIQQIGQSKKVISSSLHGLIVAETYGVPAIFLAKGMKEEIFKYEDWYASTKRPSFRYASNLDEALHMPCMPLPEENLLENMRSDLYNAFCWEYFEPAD